MLPEHQGVRRMIPMSAASENLSTLAQLIATRGVRVVDLTQPLCETTPVISLPPEVGKNSPGFSKTAVSNFDKDGPAWAWNALSMGEHCGTHFDSPNHWITGREHSTGGPATIPPAKFVAAACVIDVSAKAAANPDYLLTV